MRQRKRLHYLISVIVFGIATGVVVAFLGNWLSNLGISR